MTTNAPASAPAPARPAVPRPRETAARKASVFLSTHPRARLALLLSALGLAGLRTGALPRPLAIAALAAAGVDALAPVVLLLPKAALMIPAGRFPSLVVMGISGVRLARPQGD